MIDFGNGPFNENIILSLSYGNNGKPYTHFQTGSSHFFGHSTQSLNLNQWQNLACVFSFPYDFIYIDGNLTTAVGSMTNHPSFSLANVERSSNFIGRSNRYPYNADADADFDDLKIFNRAFSQQEIQSEMNNNL